LTSAVWKWFKFTLALIVRVTLKKGGGFVCLFN